MTPEQIQEALARSDAHLNWLHGLQAQPGHSPEEDPDLEAAINKYQSQYNDLAALAQKPGPNQQQIAATISGLEASAAETEARQKQIEAQTGQIGKQSPDNAANNQTTLTTAQIAAQTATDNRNAQLTIAGMDNGIKQSQINIAQAQIDLTKKQQEAQERMKSGDWDLERAKMELTQTENALNRALETYRIQTTQAATDAQERGNIRSTETQARAGDVSAAATAGTDALNAYKAFMEATTPAGYGDYFNSILTSGGDKSKIRPMSGPGQSFDVNAMLEGARSRERANLQGFAAPQYTRGDQPAGTGPTPPGQAMPTPEQIREAPQSYLEDQDNPDNQDPTAPYQAGGLRDGEWKVYRLNGPQNNAAGTAQGLAALSKFQGGQ